MPVTPVLDEIPDFRTPEREFAVELEQARSRRSSQVQAIFVAVVVHVILGLVATLAVVATRRSDAPVLKVLAPPETPPGETAAPTIKPREIADARDAGARMPDHFVAPEISPLALPDRDESLADPEMNFGDADLGIGFHDVTTVGDGAASFFGIEGSAESIVLVIDTSSSMPRECGPQGIAAIRKEIKRVLDGLATDSRFNIVCYGNDADRFSQRLVKATPAARKAAQKFMEGYFGAGPWLRTRAAEFGHRTRDPEGIAFYPVQPDDIRGLENTSGGSRIELGLLVAFEMKPRTIFVLSDGSPNVSRGGRRMDGPDLLELVDRGAERAYTGSDIDVKINTVSINGLGQDFLAKIATKFGGEHRDIRPKSL